MDVFLEGGIHFFTRYILLNGFIFFQWRPIGDGMNCTFEHVCSNS